MKQQQEQTHQGIAHRPWYKDPQIIVTIIFGIVSAAATIIAALI